MPISFGWRVAVCFFIGRVRNTSQRAVLMVLYLQRGVLKVRITSQTSQDGLLLLPQQNPWQQLSQLLLSEESSSRGKLCSESGSSPELSQSNKVNSVLFVFLPLFSSVWCHCPGWRDTCVTLDMCWWPSWRFWLLLELSPEPRSFPRLGVNSAQVCRL